MRRMLLCLALLGGLTPAVAVATELPIQDCLEGGSMDWTPAETATPTPSTGS